MKRLTIAAAVLGLLSLALFHGRPRIVESTPEPAVEPAPIESRSLRDEIEAEAEAARERTRLEAARTAEIEAELAAMADGIVRVQPWYAKRPQDAARIARIVRAASLARNIDPWLSLAIARRESSLLNGQVGALGELGMFQVMPNGSARRRCSQGCDLSQPNCSATTAACWLDHVREHCGGDTWTWVAAYGMRRCPTASEARNQLQARRARRFLVDLVGEERAAESWPL